MKSSKLPRSAREHYDAMVEIIQEYGGQVIDLFRGGSHFQVKFGVAGHVHTVPVPNRTSDWRSVKNILCQLRRTMRRLSSEGIEGHALERH